MQEREIRDTNDRVATWPTLADRSGSLSTAEPLSRRISRTLASAAVQARNERVIAGLGRGLAGREDERYFRYIRTAIVVMTLIIPMALSTFYLLFLASDQYVVETKVAIRATKNVTSEVISAFTGSADGLSRQAIGMLTTYLRSESLTRDLESDVNLAKLYSAPNGDLLSRFDSKRPIEDLYKFFWWKLTVSDDMSAGTLGITVHAFTPSDGITVSNAVLARMDKMIATISEANRKAILDTAQARFERAQAHLLESVRQQSTLRQSSGVIDADLESKAQVSLIYELELNLARLKAQRDASVKQLSPSALSIKTLDAQISGIQNEIDQNRAKLTKKDTKADDATLSGVLGKFEKVNVETEIARREYVSAAAAAEEARIDSLQNELYMSVFVKPQLPETSTYPKRGLIWVSILVCCLLLMSVSLSIANTVRSHRAR